MPIVSIDVRDGDPTVQASGQYRGTVDAVFDDGRKMSKNLRAPDLNGWNDAVAGAQADMEAEMVRRDAKDAVNPDEDVAGNKEASIADTCIAYIREAWASESAYDAHALLVRIDNYVTNHSNWNTAHTHLIAAGLSQEEFDQAKAAYQYLSGGGRPAIMSDARTIQQNWEDQH